MARIKIAGFHIIALIVANDREFQQCACLFGIQLNRPCERVLSALEVPDTQIGSAEIFKHGWPVRVEAVFCRVQQLFDGLLVASLREQERSKTVSCLCRFRVEANSVPEVFLRQFVFAFELKQEAESCMNGRIFRIDLKRPVELVLGALVVAVSQVANAQVKVPLHDLGRYAAGLRAPITIAGAGRQQEHQDKDPAGTHHAISPVLIFR